MDEQELIERYIDLDTDRYPGERADARLREYGVPVWALIGQWRALAGDLDQVAGDYELPREAALAYYRCNKEYIDARVLLNSAKRVVDLYLSKERRAQHVRLHHRPDSD